MADLVQKTSVFVRHLARDPTTRTARRLRPTNQLDFMLSDGRRIRRKNSRTTEISMKELMSNLHLLQEAVKNSVLEVLSPAGTPMTADELAAYAGGKPSGPKTQVKSEPKAPPVEEMKPAVEVAEDTQIEDTFFEESSSEDKSSKKTARKGKKE